MDERLKKIKSCLSFLWLLLCRIFNAGTWFVIIIVTFFIASLHYENYIAGKNFPSYVNFCVLIMNVIFSILVVFLVLFLLLLGCCGIFNFLKSAWRLAKEKTNERSIRTGFEI